jgi:AcrR family transcriptional regulator
MSPLSPAHATRLRLQEAAVLCFAARGYEGTGVRDIATRAGINASLVTYHFGGKAGLYRSLVRHIFLDALPGMVELIAGLPDPAEGSRAQVIEGLKHFIRTFLGILLVKCRPSDLEVAEVTLMVRELESPTPELEPLLVELTLPIRAYIDGCVARLRPELGEDARFAMALSIHSQVIQFRNAQGFLRLVRGDPSYPQGQLPALTQHVINFCLRGLGLPEAQAEPEPWPWAAGVEPDPPAHP